VGAGAGERVVVVEAGACCEATAVLTPAAGAAWLGPGRRQWACAGGRRGLPLRAGGEERVGAAWTCGGTIDVPGNW